MPEEKIIAAGGQAVIEGVMMRSMHNLAIAVRKPDGKISVKKERIKSLADKIKFLRWPFFRGILSLIEMLIQGIKALTYSANEALEEEEEEMSWFEIGFSLVLVFGFALIFFKFIPLWIANMFYTKFTLVERSSVLFSLIDGIVKISLFLGYVIVVSYMEDMKKAFQYHGAEHKAVNCYEAREKVTVKNCKKHSVIHARCGTSFILIVLILSIFVYALIPNIFSIWEKYLLRILLLPVIAGVSYELLKWSSKYSHKFIVKVLISPGLLMQRLTTREPTDDQVEVAIKALKTVLAMKK